MWHRSLFGLWLGGAFLLDFLFSGLYYTMAKGKQPSSPKAHFCTQGKGSMLHPFVYRLLE
jgi:hypothetical protein